MSQAKELIHVFPKSRYLNIKGALHDFGQPKIMGILNITPDSFYEQSRFEAESAVLRQAIQMVAEGADIIDIGASSTRPNAPIVSAKEEIARLGKLISILKKELPSTLISLDTYHGSVAQFGIEQGVDLINDISAGQYDASIWEVVAQHKIPYILSYNRCGPKNQAKSHLTDKGILSDALLFLSEKMTQLKSIGCTEIIVDPGFGFGKTLDENHLLLHQLEHLHLLGAPLMVGISRKSMIAKKINVPTQEALNGTSILHTLAYTKGTSIFRVHDVAAIKEMILLFSDKDLH
jgi:dihydropteroate synthase